MTLPFFCIYHANCQDGFGAAWAVRHALGDDLVEFFPGVHGNDPPARAGRDIIMVDFSYKRSVIERIAETARSVIILDHHKSAAEDLSGLPKPSGSYPALGSLSALFDMERSGAGLAWDFFNYGAYRPDLINHIEDRDLWRFKLPRTREITAAVFSYPYEFALWDELMKMNVGHFAAEGAAIERKHHRDVAELVRATRREMTIGGVIMPVANLPYTLTSDAGHKMATDAAGVAACYWDTAEGRVFSLRSTDSGPDVSEIAKRYGGGGHAHAAGFRVALGWEGECP